jgi:nucleoside-diphosphate-sugar epimerase
MTEPAAAFRDVETLVLGGLGFIGSNLARRLVAQGARVRVIDNLVEGQGGTLANIRGIEDAIEFHRMDIRDSDRLEQVIGSPEAVFNLTGEGGHLASMTDPLGDLERNCTAHLTLLECLRRHAPEARIVVTSTRQLYGIPQTMPVTEDHPVVPVDINGIHRYASEQYHRLYATRYGMGSTILRLTNTIGPGMRIRDARQCFFGYWVRLALDRSAPYEVWGGEQLRDMSYVDDVVDAMLLGARACRPGESATYNVGAGKGVSLYDLAEMLRELTDVPFVQKPFPAERKAIDIGDYVGSVDLIGRELGWRPVTPIGDAIAKTVDYYRERLADYL